MALLLAGYLSIQFFEHTLAPHFHFGAETHPESFMRPSSAYTAVGGLWIHTFFDGVSIASAFLVNFKVGIAGLYRDSAPQNARRLYCGIDHASYRAFDAEGPDRNSRNWRGDSGRRDWRRVA